MAHKAIGTSLCRLPGIRSSRARRTTTAGNHIESSQTFEPGLKFTFGRVLIGERFPSHRLLRGQLASRAVLSTAATSRNCSKLIQSAKTYGTKDEGVKLHQFVADGHGQGWPGGGFRELAWFLNRNRVSRRRDAERRTLANVPMMIHLQFGAGLSHP